MRISITLLSLCWFLNGFSQPCDYPFPPSDFCSKAPILCTLDNYCSSNKNATNSGQIDAFCGVIENNNWVSFVADTKELEIEITVSNCKKQYGLQVQILSTDNFITFKSVSNCIDPVLSKATLIAKNLIKGKRYFLMTDGKSTDVCDYSYKVIRGSTLAPTFAEIKTPDVLCGNQSILLEAKTPFLNAEFKYQWSTTDGHIKSNTQISYIEIDQPGTYKVVISEIGGCSDSTEITINQLPNPIVNIETPDTFNCKQNTRITLHATSNQANFSYFWTTLDGDIISGASTKNPIISKPGLYTLIVSNPETGCSTSSTVEVAREINKPIIKINDANELNCINPSITLDATGSSNGSKFSYQWSSSTGHFLSGNSNLTAMVDQPGVYTLQITNSENGCSNSGDVQVIYNEKKPTGADLSTYQPCFDEPLGKISIQHVIGGTLPYLYAFDDTLFQSQNYQDSLLPNDYHIIIQDAIGCEWDTTIQIVQKTALIMDLGEDIIVNLGEDVDLKLDINFPKSNIDSIFWTPNFECDTCLEHHFTPLKSENYSVRVVDQNGCDVEDRIQISVNANHQFYIPNAFTPNNDGINDIFYIFGGIDIESVLSFEIFDRWGNKIASYSNFQPNDVAFGWDGLIQGKEADQGVFVFNASVKYIDGVVLKYSGDFSLMR